MSVGATVSVRIDPDAQWRRDRLRAQLLAMDLQWFAAEDEGRTEDPTEQKIRKAREDGKVAKSADVSGAIVLLFGAVGLALLGPGMLQLMLDMIRSYFVRISTPEEATSGIVFITFLQYFVRTAAPLGAIAMAAGIVGNVTQIGFLFTTKTITPDLNRIAPNFGKWLQRSFGSTEALYNLFKSMGKVIILGAVSFVIVRTRFDQLASLMRQPYQVGFSYVAETTFLVLIAAAIVLLGLSVFDYLFQRSQHKEQLKMTKQEVKEERKQYEGDPLVRSRMRQRMQELMSRNMVQNVKSADVVVTNPTHFAVALTYDQDRMVAPTVVAKGQDEAALRIRAIAREADVPIIENRPLARALYAEVELGDTIPERYYEAMVIILREVYRMKGKKVMYG